MKIKSRYCPGLKAGGQVLHRVYANSYHPQPKVRVNLKLPDGFSLASGQNAIQLILSGEIKRPSLPYAKRAALL